MNTVDKSVQSKLYTLNVGLFCVSLIIVCFLFLHITWAAWMRPLWEACYISVFLFIFLHIQAIKSYISSIPKQIIKTYVIFFFVFSACHCFSIPRTTFPFIPWDMFSDETRYSNIVKFFRYEATTQSGKKVRLYPEVYFRSLSNGRIITDLDNLISAIIFYDPSKEKLKIERHQGFLNDYESKKGRIKSFMPWLRLNIYDENLTTLDEKKQHLNEILRAIAQRYNAWHPDDPLTSIDIIKGAIDISKREQAKADFVNVWHFSLVKEGP